MSTLPIINTIHQIGQNISPTECDIAVASIDQRGTPGELNMMVLNQLGYAKRDLPNARQLSYAGFGTASKEGKKPILFVVTVGGKSTKENVFQNLNNTLIEFREWIRDKNIWIPLLGTGSGGLTLEESYKTIVQSINNFLEEFKISCFVTLSIPPTDQGKNLLSNVQSVKGASFDKIKAALDLFTGRFFTVGAFWGNNDDQTERFIKEGIWENGYEDGKYINIINKVIPGDIFILKSSYQTNGKSYLRLKCIGTVTQNLGNGRLHIDWKTPHLNIDVEHLGKYRQTIAPISRNDIVTILPYVENGVWQSILSANSTSATNKIAGLVNDSDTGTDYLDIATDVNAFARVIGAKSFDPPLAIALFGEWGSGKSFFMKKLKEKIVSLSTSDQNKLYCKGIAHIHFNAWSYMDANLWASIVSRIFEGLNEYITKHSKTQEAKKEIERELTNQLTITKEEVNNLEQKKQLVSEQISHLTDKRAKIKEILDQKINSIRDNTAWSIIQKADEQFDIMAKIEQALDENETFVESKEELKKIIPEKYWKDPKKTYEIAKSNQTFLKEFFIKEKIKQNIVWLFFILLLIFALPRILTKLIPSIQFIDFTISQSLLTTLVVIGSIWKRAEEVYCKLQPIIASFWSIKKEYETLVEKVNSEFKQAEKILVLEIEKQKSELLFIDEKIQQAETIIADLDFKITHALATESLHAFIDKRSRGDIYKKHLGIISIIRNDFEILSNLFSDHKKETEISDVSDQLRNKFHNPLERIVLYIDDLDRCPEENVVQVLEAVNLLMAFPLFIVVVGVDSRWIKNALIKKHMLQFAGNQGNLAGDATEFEQIEPSKYLEKIFQIPFQLKKAKETKIRDMIRELAKNSSHTDNEINPSKEIINEKIPNEAMSSAIGIPIPNDMPYEKSPFLLNDKKYLNEALIISDQEIILLQDLSTIVGNNPRSIKRFVNTYRIVKVHEDFSSEGSNTERGLITILFLLAIHLGEFRKLVPSFDAYISDYNNSMRPPSFYLHPNYKVNNLNNVKDRLYNTLLSKKSYGILENIEPSEFLKVNSFTKRFTFIGD